MNTENSAWTERGDSRGVYQFAMDGPCRFYLSERRFGFRRWLLEGRVGSAYRHKFYRSEEAAKSGVQDWLQ